MAQLEGVWVSSLIGWHVCWAVAEVADQQWQLPGGAGSECAGCPRLHRRRKHGGIGGFRPQTLTVMGAMPPYENHGSHIVTSQYALEPAVLSCTGVHVTSYIDSRDTYLWLDQRRSPHQYLRRRLCSFPALSKLHIHTCNKRESNTRDRKSPIFYLLCIFDDVI